MHRGFLGDKPHRGIDRLELPGEHTIFDGDVFKGGGQPGLRDVGLAPLVGAVVADAGRPRPR